MPKLTARSSAGFRPDIQALRAVAVVLVVVYHFSGSHLPGGYIGVDVFFVISGFLIMQHLKTQSRTGRGISLGAFYSRRIRRLLPAALLVALATAVGIIIWVPQTQWTTDLKNIVASTFYVENWSLVRSATNYLNPSGNNPLQHYWSLSVEEQFYLICPLLIMFGVWLSTKRHRPSVLPAIIGVVTLLSFVTSVLWTATHPSSAYFATPTRAWEFGAGALLTFIAPAQLARIPHRIRVSAVWLGLAVIIACGFWFNASTPFPGWIALLPVLGACLVIATEQPRGGLSLQPVAEWAPVQWVGDASYSIYLWHWPLFILFPIVTGISSGSAVKGGAGVLTLLLAWLTRTFVERPVIGLGHRLHSAVDVRHLTKWFAVSAAAGMVIVSAVAVPGYAYVKVTTQTQWQQLASVTSSPGSCLGAASLNDANCAGVKHTPAYVPGALIALSVQSPADGCENSPGDPIITCTLGPQDGLPVALVGDSHAAQWINAVSAAANAFDWRVTTYLASGCPLIDPAYVVSQEDEGVGCVQRQTATLAAITGGGYKYVIVSARLSPIETVGSPAFTQVVSSQARGLAATWSKLLDEGMQVIAIANSPDPQLSGIPSVPTCMLKSEASQCALPRAPALTADDAIEKAVEATPGVTSINMNDLICPGSGNCPTVIGGVLVYADGSHLTKTYVSTLAPYFVGRLRGTGISRAD